MAEAPTRRLPLDERHRAHGARMVPFAGFAMPMQYEGIKQEHLAVRNGVGLFDVSHMGEVQFRGPDAIDAVNRLVTNDVVSLVDGQAQYAAMCDEEGGIVDDLVLYRFDAEHVFVCVNAANRQKDFDHMLAHVEGAVDVTNDSDDFVQLALQGPHAEGLLGPITDFDLEAVEYYRGAFMEVAGVECFVSRTGYTGEDGFELYIDAGDGVEVFDAIVEAGDEFDLQLCGLGARDTLRLEAKYLLYGSDMDESVNPIEAGLSWVCKLDKGVDFVGRDAIAAVKAEGPSRRMRGLVLQGRGVLRPDYEIFAGDERVGRLTSGTYAPYLEESIGLGYVDIEHANDDVVEVDIRGRRVEATLTRKPFYER